MGQRCPVPLPAWAELPVLLGVHGQCVALPDARLHLAVTLGSEGAPGVRQGARVLMPNPSMPTCFPGGAGERGQTGRARGWGRRAGEGKVEGDAGGIGQGMQVLG